MAREKERGADREQNQDYVRGIEGRKDTVCVCLVASPISPKRVDEHEVNHACHNQAALREFDYIMHKGLPTITQEHVGQGRNNACELRSPAFPPAPECTAPCDHDEDDVRY